MTKSPIEEQKKAIVFFDSLRLGAKIDPANREYARKNSIYTRQRLVLMRKAKLSCVNCCSICSRYWDGQCQLLAINVDPNWICKHFDLYKGD